MLNALKKAFSKKEETEMSQQEHNEVQLGAESMLQELATVKELAATQTAALAENMGKIAELTASLEAATAALAAIEKEKAEMVAKAVEAKMAARKEKVETAIGTEKATALLAATEGLEDAAFESVVSALAGSVEEESHTEMFREVGVSGAADASKVEEGSGLMTALKKKYGTK